MTEAPGRSGALEGLRGVASLNVLVFHCLLGFLPGLIDPAREPPTLIRGGPWYAIVNGEAAVVLFFVLSGYVLSLSHMRGAGPAVIVRNVVKRWPRLAGPAVAAMLVSYALHATGSFHHQESAALSGSPWMTNSLHGLEASPRLWDFVRQGGYSTFFRGEYSLNNNLWTMKYELYGSMAVFGLAMVTRSAPTLAARMAILCLSLLLAYHASSYYPAFIAGLALATIPPERMASLASGRPLAAGAVLLSLYLLGCSKGAAGLYAWLPAISKDALPLLWTAGAAILIVAVEGSRPVGRLLSRRPFLVLGELSFPLYLIHMSAICSFGSLTVLALDGALGPTLAGMAALAISVALSFMLAVPLSAFNRWWVALVGGASDALFSGGPLAKLPPPSPPMRLRSTSATATIRAGGCADA